MAGPMTRTNALSDRMEGGATIREGSQQAGSRGTTRGGQAPCDHSALGSIWRRSRQAHSPHPRLMYLAAWCCAARR